MVTTMDTMPTTDTRYDAARSVVRYRELWCPVCGRPQDMCRVIVLFLPDGRPRWACSACVARCAPGTVDGGSVPASGIDGFDSSLDAYRARRDDARECRTCTRRLNQYRPVVQFEGGPAGVGRPVYLCSQCGQASGGDGAEWTGARPDDGGQRGTDGPDANAWARLMRR